MQYLSYMPFSPFYLLSLLFFFCCKSTATEGDCRYTNAHQEIEITFEGSESRDMVISPFDKNKVYIILDNIPGIVEYNLLTSERKQYDRSFWKYTRARSPMLEDKVDSIIWVGGANLDLLKYDLTNGLVDTMPLRSVLRIAAGKDRTYFVTYHGLHYYDKSSVLFQAIAGLPQMFIQRSSQLDEHTLILNDSITFDMKTNTLKKGVHLYDFHHEGNLLHRFKAENKLAVVRQSGKILAVTATGVKETKLEFFNDVLNVFVDQPYLWEYTYSPNDLQNNKIHRYNIETEELTRYSFRLPRTSSYSPTFHIDGDFIWITRPQEIYIIDSKDGLSRKYTGDDLDKLLAVKLDDCSVFLLFKDKLVIKEKNSFLSSCPYFDYEGYQNELESYHAYIDSLHIKKDTNKAMVLEKLSIIKEKYRQETHPEILAEIAQLNISAFNGLHYETDSELEQCYHDTLLPTEKRASCIGILIRSLAHQGEFQRVVSLGKKARLLIMPDDHNSYYFYDLNGVDSIERYLNIADSLNKTDLPKDSIQYLTALALAGVCNTSFFCHEGCGGCNCSFMIEAFRTFMKTFPGSALVDNAAYEILKLSNQYLDVDDNSPAALHYESFINEYPQSDVIPKAKARYLQLLFLPEDRNEEELKKKILSFIQSYPNDAFISEAQLMLKLMEED
ncbi:MAG TPA: hypothetical protein VLA46_11420 [Saprospiraceae bacterium]|nr:hypothetical protein [Saprospiraceae bacterium]